MITRLTTLDPNQMEPLVVESQREGFRFLTRLRDEWASGDNRFDAPGEALFGLFAEGKLVGIGGINRVDESTGRLRRFYILPSHRRKGLGTRLLYDIVRHARRHFRSVVLRAETDSADRFYRALGFARLGDSDDPTHELIVRSNPMPEATFWNLFAKVDLEALKNGDNRRAVLPVQNALSGKSEAELAEFEEALAQKLYALDGAVYAHNAGESGTSDDGFLYARLYVVARGREFYEKVRSQPELMPKSIQQWCEPLL